MQDKLGMEASLKWTAPNSSVVYSTTVLDVRIGGAGATVHISHFNGAVAVAVGIPKGYSLNINAIQDLANSSNLPVHVIHSGGSGVFNPN